MKQLFVVVLGLMLLCGAAVAQTDNGQPNDPFVNEQANACYAGGSLEGKCAPDGNGNGIVDDYEADWAWNCGWHLIRLEAGIIHESDMPLSCAGVGHPLPCYAPVPGAIFSIQYVGPLNTGGNARIYMSAYCRGESVQLEKLALIHAELPAEAEALCNALYTADTSVLNMHEAGYQMPENIWLCADPDLFDPIL